MSTRVFTMLLIAFMLGTTIIGMVLKTMYDLSQTDDEWQDQ